MSYDYLIAGISVLFVLIAVRLLDRRLETEHDHAMEEWRLRMQQIHGGDTYSMLKRQERAVRRK